MFKNLFKCIEKVVDPSLELLTIIKQKNSKLKELYVKKNVYEFAPLDKDIQKKIKIKGKLTPDELEVTIKTDVKKSNEPTITWFEKGKKCCPEDIMPANLGKNTGGTMWFLKGRNCFPLEVSKETVENTVINSNVKEISIKWFWKGNDCTSEEVIQRGTHLVLEREGNVATVKII